MTVAVAHRLEHNPIHELAQHLMDIQQTLVKIKGTIIQEITSEDEYDRALALLDELTETNTPEAERLVDLLCASIKHYEDSAEQFAEFNSEVAATTGPQVLKFLMEQNKLTGSDLPEIGDKTVVSRTLNGKRTLSSTDIQALAKRFHLSPSSFYPVA